MRTHRLANVAANEVRLVFKSFESQRFEARLPEASTKTRTYGIGGAELRA